MHDLSKNSIPDTTVKFKLQNVSFERHRFRIVSDILLKRHTKSGPKEEPIPDHESFRELFNHFQGNFFFINSTLETNTHLGVVCSEMLFSSE